MCNECTNPTRVPLPDGQPPSLLIPLEDGWVSPTGNPALSYDVLSPLSRPTPITTESVEPVLVSQSGWLPPVLRRIAGGGR